VGWDHHPRRGLLAMNLSRLSNLIPTLRHMIRSHDHALTAPNDSTLKQNSLPEPHYLKTYSTPVSFFPGHPGRLANPRLIFFLFTFPFFLSFFTDMASPCLTLYSPRRRLGGWKGVDRLASPCRLKNTQTTPSRGPREGSSRHAGDALGKRRLSAEVAWPRCSQEGGAAARSRSPVALNTRSCAAVRW
jgi:hypothetical protein